MKITKISDCEGRIKFGSSKCEELVQRLRDAIDAILFNANVSASGKVACSIDISGVVLSQRYINQCGYNVSIGYGGRTRRGRVLGWRNWIDLNNAVNDVIDEIGISADVKSMGGKFVIRTVEHGRMNEDDWHHLAYQNVGSMMEPVYRIDQWSPEDVERYHQCKEKIRRSKYRRIKDDPDSEI